MLAFLSATTPLRSQFVKKGLLEGVTGVEQRIISVQEARAAKEVFLTSSSLPVMPVVAWDGDSIADGEVGPVTLLLHTMMERDATPEDGPSDGGDRFHAVPYGYVTRMDEDEE